MGRSRKKSQWFKLHQAWCVPRVDVVMRQEHTVGDRSFVDCTGFKRILKEPRTAAITPVELFVAAPGASNCMCAEATPRPPQQISVGHCATPSRCRAVTTGADNLNAAVIRRNPDDALQHSKSCQNSMSHCRAGSLPAHPVFERDRV